MKKLISAIFIAISIFSISCNAQTPDKVNAKHSSSEMKQMLKDSLHITDVQADSVISIREEFTSKMKQLSKDSSGSSDKRKEQLKPLREQMKMRLKAILTKDQIDKLQQMQHGMHKGKKDDNNK